jgi:hypothetical protein
VRLAVDEQQLAFLTRRGDAGGGQPKEPSAARDGGDEVAAGLEA